MYVSAMYNNVLFFTYREHEIAISIVNSRLSVTITPQVRSGLKMTFEVNHSLKTTQAVKRDCRAIVDALLDDQEILVGEEAAK